MQILNESDQERVMLSYERDYGKLLLQLNAAKLHYDICKIIDIQQEAQYLLYEISKYSNSRFFDDDRVMALVAMRSLIESHFSVRSLFYQPLQRKERYL